MSESDIQMEEQLLLLDQESPSSFIDSLTLWNQIMLGLGNVPTGGPSENFGKYIAENQENQEVLLVSCIFLYLL